MKKSVYLLLLGIFLAGGLTVAGCSEREAENNVDEAGDFMRDTADDAGDMMREAGDDVRDATN